MSIILDTFPDPISFERETMVEPSADEQVRQKSIDDAQMLQAYNAACERYATAELALNTAQTEFMSASIILESYKRSVAMKQAFEVGVAFIPLDNSNASVFVQQLDAVQVREDV